MLRAVKRKSASGGYLGKLAEGAVTSTVQYSTYLGRYSIMGTFL
jgi:hypothetical protein